MDTFDIQIIDGIAPKRAMSGGGAAGYDAYAAEDGIIEPLSKRNVRLGFKAAFDQRYVALLLDKGGMGNKGITHFGGVVDADYRDEWMAILYNSTPKVFEYTRGKPVIQVVFALIGTPDVRIVEKVGETERGTGKFNSTHKWQDVLEGAGRRDLIPFCMTLTADEQEAVSEYILNSGRIPIDFNIRYENWRATNGS